MLKKVEKTTYILHCEKCGKKEAGAIVCKNSRVQSDAEFSKFIVQWDNKGVNSAPRLTSANCRACGDAAGVEKLLG
ncbi:MAG: hypothetical protein AAGA18_12810 [Verrucomicrobiota bacterium]